MARPSSSTTRSAADSFRSCLRNFRLVLSCVVAGRECCSDGVWVCVTPGAAVERVAGRVLPQLQRPRDAALRQELPAADRRRAGPEPGLAPVRQDGRQHLHRAPPLRPTRGRPWWRLTSGCCCCRWITRSRSRRCRLSRCARLSAPGPAPPAPPSADLPCASRLCCRRSTTSGRVSDGGGGAGACL